jgi:hypothetical protein
MSTVEQPVPVTVMLPREVYERVARAAADEHRRIEDMAGALVAEGLTAHATVRELFERASVLYRARLEREGKLGQSSEEVLQELRDIREQIASELYP